MNSTIHDLYFSDTNFNYIYHLISKLVLNDTKFNILNNSKYLNIYKSNYPRFFHDIDTDDISYLNKKLVDDIGYLIIQDIKQDIKKYENLLKMYDKAEIINELGN